jgi:hypothetical protein
MLRGIAMRKSHAEDRSIIILSAVTLLLVTACWAICLL